MQTLTEILRQTETSRVALGHFNIADLEFLKAVFEAARDLNTPVLAGASEGEREFAGTVQLSALVKSVREEFDYPIYLNADHTHSLKSAIEASRRDSIMSSSTSPHFPSKRIRDKLERL